MIKPSKFDAANYLKSPQGKTPESQDNHKDAETKKFQWKCPGN